MKRKIILRKWKIRMRNRIILVNFPFLFERIKKFTKGNVLEFILLKKLMATMRCESIKCSILIYLIKIQNYVYLCQKRGQKNSGIYSFINYLSAYFPQWKWLSLCKKKVQSLCLNNESVSVFFPEIFKYLWLSSMLGLV